MSQSSYSKYFAIGQAGQIDFSYGKTEVITMRNDEASASMAFGRAVKFDDAATDPTSAKLPAAIADQIAGIVGHSHEYDDTQLDAAETGVLPDMTINVLRRGRILVVCEDAVTRGDRLHIRAVAAGDPEFLGGLLPAADTTDTIDSTGQGFWDSNAAAGELAWLIVDFTRLPA